MNKYLLSIKETYRVDTVEDAEALNREFKTDAVDKEYELKNFSYTKKQTKQRGEVIDEYVVCVATKVFNTEKEPVDEYLCTISEVVNGGLLVKDPIEADEYIYAGQEGF